MRQAEEISKYRRDGLELHASDEASTNVKKTALVNHKTVHVYFNSGIKEMRGTLSEVQEVPDNWRARDKQNKQKSTDIRGGADSSFSSMRAGMNTDVRSQGIGETGFGIGRGGDRPQRGNMNRKGHGGGF